MLFEPEDPFADIFIYDNAFDSKVPEHLRANVITGSTWVEQCVAFGRVLEDIGWLRGSIAARNAQVVMFVYISDYALTH
jgi:hypothetical protein